MGKRSRSTVRKQDMAWLAGDPSLGELQERYPAEWVAAEQQLQAATARGPAAIEALLAGISLSSPTRGDRLAAADDRFSEMVRNRMMVRAIRSAAARAESRVAAG